MSNWWHAEPVALGAFLNAGLVLGSLLWWHLDEKAMAAAILFINAGVAVLVRGNVTSTATLRDAGLTKADVTAEAARRTGTGP